MIAKIISTKSLLLLVLVSSTMLSCLDTINYELDSEDLNELAIQGRLVLGNPSVINVEVKRVFGFESGSTFYRVDSVKLSNEEGQSMLVRPLQLIGTYESIIPVGDPDFEVVEGGNYKVTVWAPGDRVYESSFETLHPKVPIDSISTVLIEEQSSTSNQIEAKDRVIFLLNTPLMNVGATNRSRINWFFQHTFKITDEPEVTGVPSKTCYISEGLNPTDIKPIDGNILNKDYLADHELYETEINYKFQEGIYLNIFQQSLSEGASEYFTQINKLTERNGNMFEGPVGELVTNFKNINDPDDEVYGYFYATAVDTFHVGLKPAEIYVPIPGLFCPPNFSIDEGIDCALEICCDCLTAPISTTTKPDYWQ